MGEFEGIFPPRVCQNIECKRRKELRSVEHSNVIFKVDEEEGQQGFCFQTVLGDPPLLLPPQLLRSEILIFD